MKKHILYSFRRCPYAIRARWALINCDVDIEIREVDLKKKPDDLLKKSREKTVPLLLLNDGTVINQSFSIILWALSIKNNKYIEKYYSEDNRVGIRKLIKTNDNIFKIHLDKFKYSSRYIDSEREYHFQKSRKIIIHWNSLLKKSKGSSYWLMGEETIADWCIFPFVRQYKIACIQQKISNYFLEPIHSWLNQFENNPIFKKTMHKYPIWDEKIFLK
tara:strand:+ start:23621 stop:24271 length:651 start_codon:yes stop_codon:yes gene_type:complete